MSNSETPEIYSCCDNDKVYTLIYDCNQVTQICNTCFNWEINPCIKPFRGGVIKIICNSCGVDVTKTSGCATCHPKEGAVMETPKIDSCCENDNNKVYTVTYNSNKTIRICNTCFNWDINSVCTTDGYIKPYHGGIIKIICNSCGVDVTKTSGCATCHPKEGAVMEKILEFYELDWMYAIVVIAARKNNTLPPKLKSLFEQMQRLDKPVCKITIEEKK